MKTNYLRNLGITVVMTFIFAGCQKNETTDTGITNTDTVSAAAEVATVATTCSAPAWASMNGGTTGGDTAKPTVVSTYDALKAAIQNTSIKVIQVDGTITIPSGGRISFQDQTGKTIFGSPGATLASTDQTKDKSGIIYVKRCKNIIIRNLIFDGPGAYDTDGWDNATLDACTNVWVDHCEFRDGLDGNFDIKNTSDYVTVSNCKFTYLKAPKAGGPGGSDDHRFSDLIGSSDGATADRGHFRITFVRCWWAQGCVARMPRVRFGQVHIVNNYFSSTVSKSCIQAGFEANLLVESNIFENVKNPIDLMDKTATAVQTRSNVFTNTSGTSAGNGIQAFIPPYSITILDTAGVKSTITGASGAGATLAGNSCSTL